MSATPESKPPVNVPPPKNPPLPRRPPNKPPNKDVAPAHPLVAIRVLLDEAQRLADAEITRADQLVQRVDEVCESERTRVRISMARTAVERWIVAAGVELPSGSGRASGLAVSASPVGAVGGSGRGAQPSAAGADVPVGDGGRGGGRVGGAPGAATFSLPKPPPFVIGEGALYDALPVSPGGAR